MIIHMIVLISAYAKLVSVLDFYFKDHAYDFIGGIREDFSFKSCSYFW